MDSAGELLFTSAVAAENQRVAMDGVATILSDFMDSLSERGFSREESMVLCQTYLHIFMTSAMGGRK